MLANVISLDIHKKKFYSKPIRHIFLSRTQTKIIRKSNQTTMDWEWNLNELKWNLKWQMYFILCLTQKKIERLCKLTKWVGAFLFWVNCDFNYGTKRHFKTWNDLKIKSKNRESYINTHKKGFLWFWCQKSLRGTHTGDMTLA